MSFTAHLRASNDELFAAFWEHPFLRSLHDGTIPRECVLHYVGQDHQYLSAFVRCYGLGIARSPDREWMGWFAERVRFVLDEEQHPHRVLCEAVGVDRADVRRHELAPSAQGYVDHLIASAHDTLGVLLAALLPCVWTYVWAGTRAVDEDPPAPDNPFLGWWSFYGSGECREVLDDFRTRVDRLAEAAGPVERERMARAFARSCAHEVRFWQMAWSREDWAVPTGA
jgi:thiaminase/transcriptional activator TenA